MFDSKLACKPAITHSILTKQQIQVKQKLFRHCFSASLHRSKMDRYTLQIFLTATSMPQATPTVETGV